jgi:hypothetical protein
MNAFTTRGQAENRTQLREKFLGELLTILGDTRLLWAPKPTDTTTSLDESLTGRTVTYDATLVGRLSALGLGYAASFNGSQYGDTPDTANLSFGDGATDSAFSVIALVNVTDSAAARYILSKFSGATVGEYNFQITAADKLQLVLYDDSVDQAPFRVSDAVITQGSWTLFGATYSKATGGATAANDITLYQNGVAIASTATNSGTYVAMENTAALGEIGIGLTHTANPFLGSMALIGLCQKSLTASDHWAIKKLVNAYFGLAL